MPKTKAPKAPKIYKKSKVIDRDAGTGRTVKKSYAEKNRSTTIRDTVALPDSYPKRPRPAMKIGERVSDAERAVQTGSAGEDSDAEEAVHEIQAQTEVRSRGYVEDLDANTREGGK